MLTLILVLLLLNKVNAQVCSGTCDVCYEERLTCTGTCDSCYSEYRAKMPTTCTLKDKCDYCYNLWRTKIYVGKLKDQTNFWMYQGKDEFFPLTNGLALDLAAARCARRFENLIRFRSGRTGPGDEGKAQLRPMPDPDPKGPPGPQTAKDPLVGYAQNGGWSVNEQDAFSRGMCSDVCMQNDELHNDAIGFTGCNCLQLSTQASDISYKIEGDLCHHNSARLLCEILGQCGEWECTLQDFMCPRYEYNRRIIPYKGYGDCISSGFINKSYYHLLITLSLMILFYIIN